MPSNGTFATVAALCWLSDMGHLEVIGMKTVIEVDAHPVHPTNILPAGSSAGQLATRSREYWTPDCRTQASP